MTGTLHIERDGHKFEVVNDGNTAKWEFWTDQFATGKWEPRTLDRIQNLSTSGGTYVDIGAWVGPTVLWAAEFWRRVVAVEPDPVAFAYLQANLATYQNDGRPVRIHSIKAAVAPLAGTVALNSGGTWGDSMSSTARRPIPDKTAEVAAITMRDVLAAGGDDVALVKIDVEGAEGQLLTDPDTVEALRDVACPLIVAIHWPWIPRKLVPKVNDFLAVGYDVQILDPSPEYPTLFLTPRG